MFKRRVAPTFGQYLVEKLIQVIAFLVLTFLMFLPTELMYVIYHLANPVGFWQTLAISGLGLFFLGSFQFVLVIIWITMLGHLYTMFD